MWTCVVLLGWLGLNSGQVTFGESYPPSPVIRSQEEPPLPCRGLLRHHLVLEGVGALVVSFDMLVPGWRLVV